MSLRSSGWQKLRETVRLYGPQVHCISLTGNMCQEIVGIIMTFLATNLRQTRGAR